MDLLYVLFRVNRLSLQTLILLTSAYRDSPAMSQNRWLVFKSKTISLAKVSMYTKTKRNDPREKETYCMWGPVIDMSVISKLRRTFWLIFDADWFIFDRSESGIYKKNWIFSITFSKSTPQNWSISFFQIFQNALFSIIGQSSDSLIWTKTPRICIQTH